MKNRLIYLIAIARSYGLAAVFKFVALSIKAKIKANDADFINRINQEQDALFDKIGISFDQAMSKTKQVEERAGIKPDEDYSDGLYGVGFAALFESGFRPENVLELGTKTATTTSFLAELFPEANIYTIELPKDDPLFAKWHGEGEAAYLNSRLPLEKYTNVSVIRANTLELLDLNLPDFDLIWLDAGHNYPEVAWDHFYSLSKLRPGGWLFIDHVVPSNNAYLYSEPDVVDVVNYINERSKDKIMVYPKRRDISQTIIKGKHIGAMLKTM